MVCLSDLVHLTIPESITPAGLDVEFLNEMAERLNCVVVPTSHELNEYGVPLYSKEDILNYIKIMSTEDLLTIKRKVDKELATRKIGTL